MGPGDGDSLGLAFLDRRSLELRDRAEDRELEVALRGVRVQRRPIDELDSHFLPLQLLDQAEQVGRLVGASREGRPTAVSKGRAIHWDGQSDLYRKKVKSADGSGWRSTGGPT